MFHRRVTEGKYFVNSQVIYISKFYDHFTDGGEAILLRGVNGLSLQ
jgi:hypothetical protein